MIATEEAKLINGEWITEEECYAKHKKLIGTVLKRYTKSIQNTVYGVEDFFNVGAIGLLKAFKRFDPSYGVKFSTYAIPMIQGEIRRELRDRGSTVRFPREYKEIYVQIAKQDLFDKPVEEIAQMLEVTKEKVQGALAYAQGVSSLNQTIYQDEGTEITMEDQLGKEQDLTQIHVDDFLQTLTEREQAVAKGVMQDKKQEVIGKEVGVSQVQVSRVIKKIGEKYKTYLEVDDMPRVQINPDVVQEMQDKGKSVKEIASYHGVTEQTIYNHMKKKQSITKTINEVSESKKEKVSESVQKASTAIAEKAVTPPSVYEEKRKVEEELENAQGKLAKAQETISNLEGEKESITACYNEEHRIREELEEKVGLFQEANKNLRKENAELSESIQNEMHHRHKAEQEANRATQELANYGEVVIAHKRDAEEWERKYNDLLDIENGVYGLMDKYREMAVR